MARPETTTYDWRAVYLGPGRSKPHLATDRPVWGPYWYSQLVDRGAGRSIPVWCGHRHRTKEQALRCGRTWAGRMARPLGVVGTAVK
jgi:hypothetical protein